MQILHSENGCSEWFLKGLKGKRTFCSVPIFILILALHPFSLASQQEMKARITGTVRDARTRVPLHYVNVWLSNTTIGVATSIDGSFSLEVPFGTWNLMVSMIGYELYSKSVEITEKKTYRFDVALVPQPIPMEGVEVTGEVPLEWRQLIQIFTKQFIGTSRNAADCWMENSEVVDLKRDESGGLTASARVPIKIVNRSLGYNLELHLLDYRCIQEQEVRYATRIRFIPMEAKDEEEAMEWERVRLETFLGSERHFLFALANDRCKEDGFTTELCSRLPYIGENLTGRSVDPHSLLAPEGNFIYKRMMFNKILHVRYRPKFDEMKKDAVLTNMNRFETRKGKSQLDSYVKMDVPYVRFDAMGNLITIYGLTKYGDWSINLVADELPMDYLPPGIEAVQESEKK